jgi:hypothetical protein
MSNLQSVITLNKQNNTTITTNNNVMTIAPSMGVELLHNEIALNALYIFYSWYNVTEQFKNKTFSYTWSDNIIYPVIVPDGLYTIDNLNEFFEYQMFLNGHYLLNSAEIPIYYISFVVNVPYLAVTLTSTPVPSTLLAGWSNPSGFALPATDTTPLFTIEPHITTNTVEPLGFGLLLGYNAGTYPPIAQSTVYQKNSDINPVAHPVNSVIVQCNLCDSGRYNTSSKILKQFSANGSIGTQLTIEPQNLNWYKVIDGYYDKIEVSFFDDKYRKLDIKDDNIIIEILLRENQPIKHHKPSNF